MLFPERASLDFTGLRGGVALVTPSGARQIRTWRRRSRHREQ